MMPAMKLNTPPVTSSQPPHSTADAVPARGSTALPGGLPQTPGGPEPPDGLATPSRGPRPCWLASHGALVGSVRTARQLSQAMAASEISAAGSSQLTCPPMSAANSLVSPAEPLNLGPAPPPRPTEPVSFPSSLPRPL